MLDTYFSAKLIDYKTIRVAIFSSISKDEKTPIELFNDKGLVEKLTIVNNSFLNGLVLYECKSKNKLVLGNTYYININSFGMVPLNVNDITFDKNFDNDYYYDGDDLGATYNKEYTTFKVWAPLANHVSLLIRKPGENFLSYKMTRQDKGVYEITLKGDFELYQYRYKVTNSGITNIVTDPYGKGSDANGKDSVVIDLNKTKMEMYETIPPIYKNYVDTIIYELHVRDFTIDKTTSIKNKGKFLGLIEEGIKTKNGNPVGFDYLKTLGITHVQLLPILDFKTVDELNPDSEYNWGYDPQQYFALEGSYSTDPNDAYSRIIECKKMISKLHQAGIRVNLDVVYNHVYEYETSVFERLVPNYYFRKRQNGLLCNATGCGNDLASERKMVRKLIIDSLTYLASEFKVDGFRFDLFGITDIDTTKELLLKLRDINNNIMIYGEGWDMPTDLPSDKKTTIYNSFKIPEVAFFNDFYRDTLRGSNFNNSDRGFELGNLSKKSDFVFAFLGSSTHYNNLQPRFQNANQSINYAECHDNMTLFDKIDACYGKSMTIKDKLRMINMINGTILLSIGVPFIHAGQEIGLSKNGLDNTYNLGDKYNMFRWDLLDSRVENYLYFKSMANIRKNTSNEKLYKAEDIKNSYEVLNLDNNIFSILLKQNKTSNIGEKFDYIILINVTNSNVYIDLKEYCKYEIGIAGNLNDCETYGRNITIEHYCLNTFYKKGEKDA